MAGRGAASARTRPAPRRHVGQRTSQRPERLARLVMRLAAAGPDGMTAEALLAAPDLSALYNADPEAGKKAIWSDLTLLCHGPLRQVAGTSGHGQHSGPEPLVRRDAVSRRYALAQPAAALHLTDDALEALCALAAQVHPRMALLGSPDLFIQLALGLPEEHRARFEAALRGDNRQHSALVLDFGLPDADPVDPQVLRLLMRARRQRQTIEFEYEPRGGEAGVRTRHERDEVLEVRIAEHAYVTIWCDRAQDEIELRVEHIVPETLRLLPMGAARRQRRKTSIRYRLTPEFVRNREVTTRLEEQRVDYQADGSAIVSGRARNLFWARRLLLGYGASAQALEPARLVADLRREVERMHEAYAGEENERSP